MVGEGTQPLVRVATVDGAGKAEAEGATRLLLPAADGWSNAEAGAVAVD